MNEDLELKPCPFCGQKDINIQIIDCADREGTPQQYVCEFCGAKGPWDYTEKLAREAWNERKGEI